MKTLMMITLMIFSGAISAKEGDPGGWSKAKWGMTEAQVEKAFAGAVPADTKIGICKYGVGMKYDAAGKLESVRLSWDKDVSVSTCYEDVVQRLKGKYGKPETEDAALKRISNQRGEISWNMKKTTIKAKMVRNTFGGQTIEFMYVDFQKAGLVEKGAENL